MKNMTKLLLLTIITMNIIGPISCELKKFDTSIHAAKKQFNNGHTVFSQNINHDTEFHRIACNCEVNLLDYTFDKKLNPLELNSKGKSAKELAYEQYLKNQDRSECKRTADRLEALENDYLNELARRVSNDKVGPTCAIIEFEGSWMNNTKTRVFVMNKSSKGTFFFPMSQTWTELPETIVRKT